MLRHRLILPAAAITLALSLAMSGVGFWVGSTIASVVSNQLVLHFVEEVDRDLGAWVGRSNAVLSRVAADIARQSISLDDPHAVLRELYGVLDDEPQVDWLYFANEAGGNVSVGRLAGDAKVFLMTDDFRAGVMRQYDASPDGQPGHLRKSSAAFDPRQKPWYRQAKDTHERFWTDPYLGASEAVLGMSLSAPILNKDGGFMGAIGTDVILTQLAREMQSLNLGTNGRAFIIDSTGQLIASSGGVAPVVTNADGRESRVLASDADDPVVRGTMRHFWTQPDILRQLPRTGLQSFSFDDPMLGTSYAAAKIFQAAGGISWTIVAAVPASDFLGPARSAVFFSVAIGVFVLAVALVLGTWMVGLVLRPLTALTEAARSIGRGEWPEIPEVQRSDEIGLLARAFKFMTTRLKDTQDGLRRSEASLTEAQQIGHTGSWRWKIDTGEVSWSTECYRIFAADPATTQPSYGTFLERVHPEDRFSAKQVLERAVRERSRYRHEYRITLPDGSVKHLQAVGQPDLTGSGGLEFVGTITDITELRRAEEALRNAEAELARMTRLTTAGELLASIAHEIHQPLAAVATSGSAGLRWLNRDQPDLDAARDAFSRIVRDAHRAGNVIHGLRALAQKSEPQLTKLDINGAIQEVLALSRSDLQQHGVVLHTDLSAEVRPVFGDRVQLQQVLLNLITNAVDAMRAVADRPKVLTITSKRVEPDGMLVAIEDTGTGLDPAMADRIFTPFATTKPNGMGMGLSICRSIIEAHGGRLWVSPRVPCGTVFRFTVPAVPPD